MGLLKEIIERIYTKQSRMRQFACGFAAMPHQLYLSFLTVVGGGLNLINYESPKGILESMHKYAVYSQKINIHDSPIHRSQNRQCPCGISHLRPLPYNQVTIGWQRLVAKTALTIHGEQLYVCWVKVKVFHSLWQCP